MIWKNKLGLPQAPFYYTNDNENNLSIFVRGVTGFISIEGYSFEIKPKFLDSDIGNQWKIALSNLLFLQEDILKYKSNMIHSNIINETLPDLLAEKFISELEKGLLLGLPKGYILKEESVPYYKGTYNINKAIEHLIQPHLIPSKFDDYVEDILVNRIIKLASIELSKLVKNNSLATRLNEMAYQINATDARPDNMSIERTALPLQFSYLETVFDLSKLILTNNSIIFSEGKYKNSGFLWNTHVIFENFIKILVRLICKRNRNLHFTDKKLHLYSLANPTVSLSRKTGLTSPDVRIYEGSTIRWLLDVKYKNWKNGPKSEDVYQMITGAQLTKIDRASLIYPKGIQAPSEQVYYNINKIQQPKFISCIFIDILKLSLTNGLNLILDEFENDLNYHYM